MLITGQQLRRELIAAGIPPAAILPFADDLYQPCRAEWLTGDYHRWFLKALEAFDIRPYEAGAGDCDDFATLFAAFARIAHRRTPHGKEAALPIGPLWYDPMPRSHHAIDWAYTVDKGVIFPEPQVLFQVNRLSVLQLQSITRCTE